MNAPTRPVLRWHGGKWKLAPWIISHFPKHRVYVELFGGAASVLLRKARALTEIYNDLDHHVVSLFRVMQAPPSAARLVEALRVTPFARAEFDLAFEVTDDPVEAARRLIVRSFFSGGTRGILDLDRTQAGFNGSSARSRGDNPQRSHAQDWSTFADTLPAACARFMTVVIENRPALELIEQHDAADTLFYCDPPYMEETRSGRARRAYRHEMVAADHGALLQRLRSIEGMTAISGYGHPLYDDILHDWRVVQTEAHADGARPRTEVLWINPQCAAALDRERRTFKQLELIGAAE